MPLYIVVHAYIYVRMYEFRLDKFWENVVCLSVVRLMNCTKKWKLRIFFIHVTSAVAVATIATYRLFEVAAMMKLKKFTSPLFCHVFVGFFFVLGFGPCMFLCNRSECGLVRKCMNQFGRRSTWPMIFVIDFRHVNTKHSRIIYSILFASMKCPIQQQQ